LLHTAISAVIKLQTESPTVNRTKDQEDTEKTVPFITDVTLSSPCKLSVRRALKLHESE